MGLGYRTTIRTVTLVLLGLTITSCTGFRAARQAEIASETGDWDAAVLYWSKAIEQDPTDIRYKANLLQSAGAGLRRALRAGQEVP